MTAPERLMTYRGPIDRLPYRVPARNACLKKEFQHPHDRFEDEYQTCISSRCELFSAPSIVSDPRTTFAQIFCAD